jgi:uncharacterized protein (TIGR03089 family)
MGTVIAATVPAIFAAAVAAEPARPMVTFYDDATDERTELSGATLANWVAKTGNLLADGYGLGLGDTAAVTLPPHWQTAGVLLGCWAAGLAVDTRPAAAAVAFAAAAGLPEVPAADTTFALSLHPLALPMRPPPPSGVIDYVVEVRQYGDHFVPAAPVPVDALALDGMTHDELIGLGRSWARRRGLDPGERILVDADAHADPLTWLVAPLVAGASTVICRNLDRSRLDARVAAERVTHAVLGD